VLTAAIHTNFNEHVCQKKLAWEVVPMTTTYTQSLIKSGIAAAVLVLSIPSVSSAQANGPTWLRFQITKVRPEMRLEYEGYMKQIATAYKKTSVPFFITYQNVAGDLTEFTTVLPLIKFGEMDGPSPLLKVLGEDALANLGRSAARCEISASRYYSLPMNDLMINKGAPAGTLWLMTRTFLNPGKLAEYETWMKNDWKPAMEKAGVTQLRVSRPIFGLPGGEIQTVRMLKDFAEIDSGPILTQKLGADAARALNAKTNGMVRATTNTLIRIRADLSYLPQPATGSN
jgi:hypothetical protein